MSTFSVILYISVTLFISSIVLWYVSGAYVKEQRPALSRKMVYIGGFLFMFSIVGVIVALIVGSTN